MTTNEKVGLATLLSLLFLAGCAIPLARAIDGLETLDLAEYTVQYAAVNYLAVTGHWPKGPDDIDKVVNPSDQQLLRKLKEGANFKWEFDPANSETCSVTFWDDLFFFWHIKDTKVVHRTTFG